MKTVVVNKFKKPFDVYIGRPGLFGNPFVIGPDGNREEVIAKFRKYFLERIEVGIGFREKVLELRGKRLGCYCKPKACHGDVIVAWLTENKE